jgi:hypothetical protein
MDLLPNKQNFDLDKCRQKFHHSLKEHHKISNILKFRCKIQIQNSKKVDSNMFITMNVHQNFQVKVVKIIIADVSIIFM